VPLVRTDGGGAGGGGGDGVGVLRAFNGRVHERYAYASANVCRDLLRIGCDYPRRAYLLLSGRASSSVLCSYPFISIWVFFSSLNRITRQGFRIRSIKLMVNFMCTVCVCVWVIGLSLH